MWKGRREDKRRRGSGREGGGRMEHGREDREEGGDVQERREVATGGRKDLKPELKEKTGEIGLGWNLCSLNNVA